VVGDQSDDEAEKPVKSFVRGSNSRLPSPAIAIALVALFAALGGTGYAVVRLVPRNSVGSAQVVNGSL
jgi:hypothetical protein